MACFPPDLRLVVQVALEICQSNELSPRLKHTIILPPIHARSRIFCPFCHWTSWQSGRKGVGRSREVCQQQANRLPAVDLDILTQSNQRLGEI